MSKIHASILSDIARYYSEKLAEHGESPRGVDWNGEQGQILRFTQLCKIIDVPGPFSINDLGCGYGALCGFLEQHHSDFSYTGIDISEKMIEAASRLHTERTRFRFVCASEPDQIADYGIASGIFNVQLGKPDSEWKD